MNCIVNIITTASAPHQHNEYEIIIYTKGQGTCYAEEEIPVSQGKIMIIPPNTVHRCTFPDELERIYIRGEFSHFFSFSDPVLLVDNAQGEGAMLAKMIYHNRYANPEYAQALTDAFLHFLLQSIRTEDRIHMAITHIIHQIANEFFDYDIDLKKLLEKSGYAEDYIRSQFKKTIGKTPNEFLTDMRIRHACCLLDTYGKTVSLKEIASQCGYTDYVYFSKKFKTVTGISPRTYIANTFTE